MEQNERRFAELSRFGQDLLYKLLPEPWGKGPGIRQRVQHDLSKVLAEARFKGGSIDEYRYRIERTIRESLAWELKNLNDHCSAQVERIPTEYPGVDAYLVTLPDGTPCTTLNLEGAAVLYGIELRKLQDWVRKADLAAYHVIHHTFEDEGDGENVYTPTMDLYAVIDLERMLSKRKLDIIQKRSDTASVI